MPEIKKIISDLKDFSLGGKRLRGFLTTLGFQFFSNIQDCHPEPRWLSGRRILQNSESHSDPRDADILKFSAGVELLHSALLAHDDIIDKDKLRRGLLTLHEKYGKFRTAGLSLRRSVIRGKKIAQYAANLLFAFGFELALKTNFSPQRKVKALLYLRQKLFNTALGEILDVHFSGRADLKEKDILQIHTLKTANYTFQAPFFCGAILAGQDFEEIKKYEKWAQKLGQAFQIKDDLLGIFGKEKILGKPIGSDLKEGKMTLVFKKALALASLANQRKFLKIFGKENLNKRQIQQIKNFFYSLGVEKETEKEAQEKVKEAKKEILKLPFDLEQKRILLDLADFVVKREK